MRVRGRRESAEDMWDGWVLEEASEISIHFKKISIVSQKINILKLLTK